MIYNYAYNANFKSMTGYRGLVVLPLFILCLDTKKNLVLIKTFGSVQKWTQNIA